MSSCFVPGNKQLNVERIIDYLECDFSSTNPHIKITGDFLIENPTSAPQYFSFIHRGNIDFRAVSVKCPDDLLRLLQSLYGPSRFEVDARRLPKVSIVDVFQKRKEFVPYKVRLARLIKPRTRDFVPFSIFKTNKIKQGARVLFRVQGMLESESFRRLIGDMKYFSIYGGEVLMSKIGEEVSLIGASNDKGPRVSEYRKTLEDFCSIRQRPERYDLVAWEASGKYRLEMAPQTIDLNYGVVGKRIEDKLISWYWSEPRISYDVGMRQGPRLGVELVRVGKQESLWK